MANKIGITMRIDTAAGRGEQRDSLARNWADFMSRLCPGVTLGHPQQCRPRWPYDTGRKNFKPT